ASVHEHAIFGIKLPDRVASPIVVDKNPLRIMAGLQERDCSLGKQLRLASVLVASKTDPVHQGKRSHQNENRRAEKRPEPPREGCPTSRAFRDVGLFAAISSSRRESRGDYRYRHQHEDWNVANGVQSGA